MMRMRMLTGGKDKITIIATGMSHPPGMLNLSEWVEGEQMGR